ncbi:hypothetical protein [Amycolatopsis sp. NPDC051372]|uniref:hypothetical protein n=1 Tax=Amycolatopsis sp. NPDC051372 TaxID=3155669 RepID=UPI00341CE52C
MPQLGALFAHTVRPGTVIGLPALVVNLVVTVLVSLVTRAPAAAAIDAGTGDSAPAEDREPVGEAALH